MTVYELIQELAQYDADAEIKFNVKGNLDFDTVVEFDRENEDNEQNVTVNVDLDDRFEFARTIDWTTTKPKIVEIQLEY